MPIAVPPTPSPPPVVRIAIIGAGPAGLGAAIALSHLAHPTSVAFEVTVYEQARELKEIGAGLSLHENAFRVLSVLGAREATVGFNKKGTQHVCVLPSHSRISFLFLRTDQLKVSPFFRSSGTV